MDRLTGLDGAFLSLESPTSHLHILGALVFDPTEVPGGVDFWQIREVVAERLNRVEPFRKRMIEVPFGLQHPAMVDDPSFDIDYHVRRVSLPAPGGREELAVLMADVASRPLDRSRPLWEFHVVEGLEDGQLAVIPKVHHSIIDGVSGAELMAAFFDVSPVPAPRPLFGGTRGPRRQDGQETRGSASGRRAATDPSWSPDPLPGGGEQLRSVLGSLPGHADALLRTVSKTLQNAHSLSGHNRKPDAPPPPFTAPHTSVNRAISAHRRIALTELPLGDVRRIREVLGGTTNDVVLTIVSGAMRAFFAERGEDLERPLVAMVPVSVRTPSEQGALGNRVSAMLVSLADRIDDPAERLRAIGAGTRSAKKHSRAIGPELFAGWAQSLFPAVATRLTRLVTNIRLFDHLGPVFNLIVSNVPGPDFPLYLAGARMVAMYPVGPIVEGVGINVTVFTYLDTVYVGVQGCRELVPDIESITSGMSDSRDELMRAVNRRVRPIPWWHGELPA
jgi:diacylglycerol O-acyltransferase / wax synthase